MTDSKDTLNETAASPFKVEARVTPIEPKDNLIAFASVTIDDCFVIEGLRVCMGEKGLYVNMPSTQGKDGQWRDIAFPVTSDARAQINDAVKDGYTAAIEKMQATVEAAKAATKTSETREEAARTDTQAKPSALEALKSSQEQAKAQPVKAAAHEDKAL